MNRETQEAIVGGSAPLDPQGDGSRLSARQLRLILTAVAAMKGLKPESIAVGSGIPLQIVNAYLAGQGLAGVRVGSFDRIAPSVGIDPATCALDSKQVHFLDLASLSRFDYAVSLEGLALALQGALVARLNFHRRLAGRIAGEQYFLIQAAGYRAIARTSRSRSVRFDRIPSVRWACRTAERSVAEVPNEELMAHIRGKTLTVAEFDEILQGEKALQWADVVMAARFGGVTKAELMGFIHMRAEALEADERARTQTSQRPGLHLVGGEERVVNG